MQEYGYEDFLGSLDAPGQAVLSALDARVASISPEIGAHGVRYGKAKNEWEMYYRAHPKHGKTVCALFSSGGRLSARFAFLPSMTRAFLLRREMFSPGFAREIMRQTVCAVRRKCRAYGGNEPCQWRQYFWTDGKLVTTCPYPWITLAGLSESDIPDLLRLAEMQLGHMAQDAKDIKGEGYAEGNRERCGDVRSRTLGEIALCPRDDVTSHAPRLERYLATYSLVPLGENDGLWFYRGDAPPPVVDSLHIGCCASVTIDNPASFSLNRAWNYICGCLDGKGLRIRETAIGDKSAACFARLFIDGGKQKMTVYVPVEKRITWRDEP